MSAKVLAGLACGVITVGVLSGYPTRVQAQQQAAPAAPPAADADDPIKTMVGRLDLEKYKATIKGLTQFGDRRQGTERNRAAVDWIEAQLKSYGCTNTERIKYDYQPRAAGAGARRAGRAVQALRRPGSGGAGAARGSGGGQRGGGRGRGRARAAARSSAPRAAPASTPIPTRSPTRSCASSTRSRRTTGPARRGLLHEGRHDASRRDVHRRRAHGRHGWGEAANDDGSGTALVMELARIFSSPDVQTERSIRFALWNNEETGPERRAAPTSSSARTCRARRIRRDRARIRSRSGSA